VKSNGRLLRQLAELASLGTLASNRTIRGGVIAVLIIFGTTYLAESVNAPILYIGEFIGFILSTLATLHIAFSFAPSYKRTVIVILITIAVLGDLSVVHLILQAEAYKDLCGVIGSFIACLIGLKVYLWDERSHTAHFNTEPIEERIGSILGTIWGVIFTIGLLFAFGSMIVAFLNWLSKF
jgi:hypothetical protein